MTLSLTRHISLQILIPTICKYNSVHYAQLNDI